MEVRLDAVTDGVGEVCVRAPNVAARYWPDLPALDAQCWFHSGDLARQAADGSFTIVGRAKDMIISGGENIYPAELESLLAAVPGVAEVAVIGLPHARWGEEVVAVVVAAAGQTVTPAQLQAALQERVARYKQPRRYLLRESLPKTALGKVQKARLVAELLSKE